MGAKSKLRSVYERLLSRESDAASPVVPRAVSLNTSLLAIYGSSLHTRDFGYLRELAVGDIHAKRLSRTEALRLLKLGLAAVVQDGSLQITPLGRELITVYDQIRHDDRL